MNQIIFIFGIFVIIATNINEILGDCDRSRFILGAEDVCWARKVEMVERISYAHKRVVNFAKKTLGLDADEKEEPQKCDYYYCIFSEMKLLNPEYDVPCIERTSNWVKKNIKYDQAVVLLERIQSCSKELGNSLGAKQQFLADNVGASERKVIETDQSRCEIAAEYMKCLDYNQKDPECPVFHYP